MAPIVGRVHQFPLFQIVFYETIGLSQKPIIGFCLFIIALRNV